MGALLVVLPSAYTLDLIMLLPVCLAESRYHQSKPHVEEKEDETDDDDDDADEDVNAYNFRRRRKSSASLLKEAYNGNNTCYSSQDHANSNSMSDDSRQSSNSGIVGLANLGNTVS